MPADLPESVSISGAEIKLTVCAVSNGVLCSNLAESKSVLKMCPEGRRCIFKGWEKAGVKKSSTATNQYHLLIHFKKSTWLDRCC